MADEEISKDSKPSNPAQKRRPAATIDLPASEAGPSETPAADGPAMQASLTPDMPRSAFTPMLASAIGGAMVFAAGMAVLWYLGFILARDAVTADMSARLAKLETQPRSAALAADQSALNDIAARIARLETATQSSQSTGASSAPRVTALESNVKTIGDSVTALASRGDDVRAQLDTVQKALAELRGSIAQQKGSMTDNSELEKVTSRIAPLETELQNVKQAVSARENTTADRAVRHAMVAASLRDSVLRGASFALELAAFKSLGGDAAAVAPLESFAAQGVPSADKLGAELVALLQKLVPDADKTARSAGFLDRLQINAERLVRIRPVGDAAGSDTKAVMARAESKAARADIDGALSELSQLPPQQRVPVDAWIEKAKARQAALAAVHEISAKSVGALAPAAPR